MFSIPSRPPQWITLALLVAAPPLFWTWGCIQVHAGLRIVGKIDAFVGLESAGVIWLLGLCMYAATLLIDMNEEQSVALCIGASIIAANSGWTAFNEGYLYALHAVDTPEQIAAYESEHAD